ncbi:MAG: phage portal protein [Rhodobacteraceae bacterium]|nr:phage portal protein [Paracoccaceae bacterium]
MADAKTNEFISLARPSIPLFPKPGRGGRSWAVTLLKSADKKVATSNQGVQEGIRPHPFDMAATGRFMTANCHHSACIAAKVNASVGIGLANDKTEETLDDLCQVSWQSLVNQVGEDLESTGNGYFEVVRLVGSGEIVGLHHLLASGVHIFVESVRTKDFHFEVRSKEGDERRFARFDDHERFSKVRMAGLSANPDEVSSSTYSEVIHLKETTSQNAWYGIPRWLSAVAPVELVMAILQHNFDFFNNRGVPEFILFVLGSQVATKDWAKIETNLRSHIGLGNARKSMAVNLPSADTTVQLEKLGMDSDSEGAFGDLMDALSMLIVSAHNVPPQLAGIMIPGKLGATNELPNAMAVFQTLVISPRQKLWTSVLNCSLGHSSVGIKGLTRKSFKWNTITDEINLPALDAVAQSRTPLANGPTPTGQGPKGGKRPPEKGSPAARLQALQKENRPLTLAEKTSLICGIIQEVTSV